MSTINVIPDLVRWVVRVLSEDSVLLPLITSADSNDGEPRVWENQATEQRSPSGFAKVYPDNPDFPCIRFEIVECEHTNGNGARRFASHPLLLIEGIDEGESTIALETIANRISALFARRARGVEGQLTVNGSICEEDYTDTDETESGVYKHLGGVFSFFVFKTP